MTRWRSFIVGSAIAVMTTTAAAQDDAAPSTGLSGGQTMGSLAVRSDPPGAVVRADGPIRLAGRTPWTLSRGLVGTYELKADLKGYETWKRTIYLDGVSADTLSFRLSPKTALRAGLRSMIVPGWGQRYSDQRTKGTLFFIGSALAGVAWVVSDQIYDRRIDDLNDAKDAYLEAEQVELQEELWGTVERERRRASNAYDDREIASFAFIGIYLANLLDSLLLFPGPSPGMHSGTEGWGGLHIFGDSNSAGVGMAVHY